MNVLTTPRMDRCIGCHSCSLACARLIHQRLSWSASGIRIHSSGGLSTGFVAVRCLACEPPPCASACPTRALTPRKSGGVVVRKKHCIQCGACVPACPVDGVYQSADGNIYICIHCGRCVEFCPHHCLELKKTDEIGEVLL